MIDETIRELVDTRPAVALVLEQDRLKRNTKNSYDQASRLASPVYEEELILTLTICRSTSVAQTFSAISFNRSKTVVRATHISPKSRLLGCRKAPGTVLTASTTQLVSSTTRNEHNCDVMDRIKVNQNNPDITPASQMPSMVTRNMSTTDEMPSGVCASQDG